MSAIEPLFEEYADYHREPLNRWAHVVGFPLIGMGLTGLTEWAGGLWAVLAVQGLIAAANVFTHARLGVWCTGVLLGLWLAARPLPVGVLVGLLAFGVGLPVLTHVAVERRWPDTPARFARFERVGHLWFLRRGLRRLGIQD